MGSVGKWWVPAEQSDIRLQSKSSGTKVRSDDEKGYVGRVDGNDICFTLIDLILVFLPHATKNGSSLFQLLLNDRMILCQQRQ